MKHIRYVVISPVRNEEDYIKLTLDSMVEQTVKPIEWILVNDGSTDSTESIIKEYASKYDWIKLITLTDRGYYFPGTGVVNVFNNGYAAITEPNWNYVVKLDVDLSFDPDYFETVLGRMETDPKIGLASGWPQLPLDGGWVKEEVQPDHPVGPSKIYKKAAWEAMGGLLPVPGWDLADVLGAQMHGWTTICFGDITLFHHRISGVRRSGLWSRKFLQGRFEYRHGYRFIYTFLKATRAAVRERQPAELIAKVSGFIWAAIKHDEPLFPQAMQMFLRKKQLHKLAELLHLRTPPTTN